MKKLLVFGLVWTMALSVPANALAAAAGSAAVGHAGLTGAISGKARTADGRNLPGNTVRIRNSSTGLLSAALATDAGGAFTAAGLTPGSYLVEVLGATGTVIGLSPITAVAAGSTATVMVTATAAGTLQTTGAQSGGASSGGGIGAVAITAIVAGAAIAGIVIYNVTKDDASPSQ